MNSTDESGHKSYIFNVDLMIKGPSNAKAIETLLKLLNQASVADFKIHSGTEFGRLIEQIKQEPRTVSRVNIPSKLTSSSSAKQAVAMPNPAPAAKPAPPETNAVPEQMLERIKGFISGNRLIRLNVNKGLGVKLSVPCRIVNFDEQTYMMTVYHVDEKIVYTFSINEIDDFVE
jgi:hypothetical protein